MASRGVHEPPGKAARGLASWAVDLWPSVNGRALMNGLQLSSMEASDMLDVVHTLFEEDNAFVSEEQMKSKLAIRDSVYTTLYGIKDFKYKYVAPKNAKTSQATAGMSATQDLDFGFPEDEDIKPFNPREPEPTKPFIPPTKIDLDDVKPFGSILDAPLG